MAVWESELNDAEYVNLNTVGIPTYKSLQEWFNATQSSGLLCGGGFADNENGSVTVAAGCGIVKIADDIVGNTIFFDWPENTNVTLVNNSMNYVYVDYNSGNPVVNSTDTFDAVNFTTQFTIGLIYREGTNLHILESGSRRYDLAHRILIQDYEVNGFQRANGLIINETGTRNFSISEGSFYYISDKHILSAFDSSGVDTFTYHYRDGDTGWTEVADQSQIDNFYYDNDSGTLAEIGNNRYGIGWIYQEFDGNLHVIYGQGSYKLAEANDAQPPTTRPTMLTTFAFVVGKIIIFKNAAVFAELHSAFDVVFTPSVIVPHNDTTAIQGGTTDEYYHLTSAQHTLLTGNLYQSHNLLNNSRFNVNSNSTLENKGTQITLTDVTSGVCSTADTQDIAVGDLFKFDSGDHDTVVGRITDVTTDVSFTLSDTTLTDSGSPGTGYQAVPGYVASDAKAPDGWRKAVGVDAFVISPIVTGGAAAVKLANTNTTDVFGWPTANKYSTVAHLDFFRGRQVTFGAWVKTVTANHARLGIRNPSSPAYSAYHSGSGLAEWLEVTVIGEIDPSYFIIDIFMKIASSECEISDPVLIFGGYIGEGNYAPKPDEYVPLIANEVLLIDNDTVSTDQTIDILVDSLGKIPAGAKTLQVRVKGTCATAGKTLSAGQSDDVSVMSQVSTVPNQGSGLARVIGGELEITRDDTFTAADVAVTGVWL